MKLGDDGDVPSGLDRCESGSLTGQARTDDYDLMSTHPDRAAELRRALSITAQILRANVAAHPRVGSLPFVGEERVTPS
jgi:hypothetical protein